MTDQEKIAIIIEAQNRASMALNTAQQQLQGLAQTGKKAGEEIDSSMRRATRFGLRELGSAFSGLASTADQQLGTVVSRMTDIIAVGVGLGATAGAFALVSSAIGLIVAASQKAAEEAKKVVAPFEELEAALVRMAKLVGVPAFAKTLGVDEAALARYVAESEKGVTVTTALARKQQEAAIIAAQMTYWMKEYANAQEIVNNATSDARTRGFALAAMQRAEKQLENLRGAATRVSGEIQGMTAAARDDVMAFTEATRKKEIFEKGLLSLSQASINLGTQLRNLAKNHTRAMEELAQSTANAVAQAAEDIQTALDRATEHRADVAENLAETIADIEKNLHDRIADMERDRGKRMEDFAKDEIAISRDAAKEIAEIEKDLQESIRELREDTAKRLEDVGRDAMDRESTAKTYAEVLRIRADAERRRKDIRDESKEKETEIKTSAAKRKADIAERKRERLLELSERKREYEEDYNYQRMLAERQAAEQRARAQKETADRIAEIEKQTAKSIAEIEKQKAKSIAAIEERKAKEIQSYKEAQAEAQIQYAQQMKNLFDMRTETDKVADAVRTVRNSWTGAIDELVRYLAYLNMIPTGGAGGWAPGTWRPPTTGWYQGGGIVPGPRGMPQAAVVHGGEIIIDPSRQKLPGRQMTVIVQGSIYGDAHLEYIMRQVVRQYDEGRL